jgi:hypothetical protein
MVGHFTWNLVLRNDLLERRGQVGETRASQNIRMTTLEGPVQEQGGLFEPEGGSPQPTSDPMLTAEL